MGLKITHQQWEHYRRILHFQYVPRCQFLLLLFYYLLSVVPLYINIYANFVIIKQEVPWKFCC